jgi:hypothetical protein
MRTELNEASRGSRRDDYFEPVLQDTVAIAH